MGGPCPAPLCYGAILGRLPFEYDTPGPYGSRLGLFHASERADTTTSRKRGVFLDNSHARTEHFVDSSREFCHTARDAMPCIPGFVAKAISRISRFDVSFIARGHGLSSGVIALRLPTAAV